MFFDLQLLRYQSNGVFCLAWLAAIYGTKPDSSAIARIEDKRVKATNIVKLCESLQKYILSTSSNVGERLSLRLSAILLNGVIKIHRRQAVLFQQEIFNRFERVQRRFISGFLHPKASVEKDKKKRVQKKKGKADTVEVPEFSPITLEDLSRALQEIPRALPEQITMLEEVSTRAPIEPTEEDRFGDEGDVNTQILMLSTDFSEVGSLDKVVADIQTVSRDPGSFERILEQIPVSQPREIEEARILEMGQKRRRSSVGTEPSKRMRTEVVEALPAAAEAVAEPQQTIAPDATVEETVARPFEQPQKRIKRRKGIQLNLVKKTPVMRKKWIDNSGEGMDFGDEQVFLSNSAIQRLINNLRKTASNEPFAGLFNERTQEEATVDVHVPLQAGSQIAPAQPSQISLEVAPRDTSGIPSVEMPTHVIPRVTDMPSLQFPSASEMGEISAAVSAIEEVVPLETGQPQLVHSTPMPMREVPHPPPTSFTIEETQSIIPAPVAVSPVLIERSQDTLRREKIVEIVTFWDFEQADLTIEDVCPKPINRRSIAITFNDLLLLHKEGYVDLKHQPGSLELGLIDLGPKLLNN